MSFSLSEFAKSRPPVYQSEIYIVALTWLRDTIEVHDEMEEMRSEHESMKLISKVTLKELLVNSSLRIPLIIAVMVMLAQQFSGINAVMFYSTKIFRTAQLSQSAAQNATMGVGAMNVLMTLVSLILVERAGRKTLLLVGFSGMCIDTILLTISLAFSVSISHLLISLHRRNILIVTLLSLPTNFIIFLYRTHPT